MPSMDSGSVAQSHRQPQTDFREPAVHDSSDDKSVTKVQSVPGEAIVKIREGIEPPLIIIHGGYGSVHAFWPLKQTFSTTLWAIQVTLETPLHSLQAQAGFYFRAIKVEQVNGPYHICSFSASSLIAVAITKLLESNGDTVEQLSFIDHFPTTFIIPILGVDITRVPLSDPRARHEFFKASVKNLVAMTRRDKKGMNAKRHKMADDLQAAYQDLPTSLFMMQSKVIMDGFLSRVFDFIVSLSRDSLRNGDQHGMGFMENWLKSVKAPVTVYLGTYGMLRLYSPDQYPPAEWNVHQSFNNVTVTVLDAGHYDILENEGLIRGLQEGYIVPQRTARL